MLGQGMRQKTIYERFFKRPLDLIVGLIALVFLCPLFVIISVLVIIKLGRPVIFTQIRPGLNEKVFRIYKFRTMTDKKDKQGNLSPDSERLTKFGKFLRATSIDELPELLNIVRGHMSFVGPRPLLVEYLPLYNERQKLRHTVRPGLTGWAQINGRNAIAWDEKFELDVKYIEKITVKNDAEIFFKTILKAFKREGVSSNNHSTMEPFCGSK
jgi:undecaprenyl phosphate N,N'-diacetylbacillosamine 1-phosphate transferase